ncbi:hypothetical protein AALC25_02340 [Lachnospiraceae bacterium 29-84]
MPHSITRNNNIRKDHRKISLRQTRFRKQEALFHTLQSASLTVEAALSLPIFLFAAAMTLYLSVMMQVQYCVKDSLDLAVAEASLLREAKPAQAANVAKAAFYKNVSRQGFPMAQIVHGIAGFSWKNTKADAQEIRLQVTYQIKFPFVYFGKHVMKFSHCCKMHRWTGNQDGAVLGEDGAEWVYITPNDSVYHKSRSCTHLTLSVTPIPAAGLKKQEKYAPCGHCTKGQVMGTVVYITAQGGCYHYKINCSGLKRTIYMIRKEDASGRRLCTRCKGKG